MTHQYYFAIEEYANLRFLTEQTDSLSTTIKCFGDFY